MKKNDNGLDDLLKLLRKRPELVKELIFHAPNIQRLLKSPAARRLALGVDASAFLTYLASDEDGYAIAQCFGGTESLCAKGTGYAVCGGSTEPTVRLRGPCGGSTETELTEVVRPGRRRRRSARRS
jgi:hypothetical protein